MEDKLKVRYFPPSKFDPAPYGQMVYVDSEKEGLTIYIQLSQNPEEPNWQKGRYLLEEVFKDHLSKPEFIEICVKIFETKDKTLFQKLKELI
jgi:hypothetical protein